MIELITAVINGFPQEIVLHTLFESGNSKVQDLEKYIRDDVERYATRLNELEKKIVGAYRETVSIVAVFVNSTTCSTNPGGRRNARGRGPI